MKLRNSLNWIELEWIVFLIGVFVWFSFFFFFLFIFPPKPKNLSSSSLFISNFWVNQVFKNFQSNSMIIIQRNSHWEIPKLKQVLKAKVKNLKVQKFLKKFLKKFLFNFIVIHDFNIGYFWTWCLLQTKFPADAVSK